MSTIYRPGIGWVRTKTLMGADALAVYGVRRKVAPVPPSAPPHPRKAAPVRPGPNEWLYRIYEVGDPLTDDQMGTARAVLRHIRRQEPAIGYPSVRIVTPIGPDAEGDVRDHIAGPKGCTGWAHPDYPDVIWLLRDPDLGRLAHVAAHEARHLLQAKAVGWAELVARRDEYEQEAEVFARRVMAELEEEEWSWRW